MVTPPMNTLPTKHKVSPQLFAAERILPEKSKRLAITPHPPQKI